MQQVTDEQMEKITAISQGLEVETQVTDVFSALESYNTAKADVESTWATFGEVRAAGGSLTTTDDTGADVTITWMEAYLSFA